MHEAFEVHKLSEYDLLTVRQLSVGFNRLLGEVERVIGPCRELSIVTTKLEEACFFAKKGFAKGRSIE